jgi:hypothetical protein
MDLTDLYLYRQALMILILSIYLTVFSYLFLYYIRLIDSLLSTRNNYSIDDLIGIVNRHFRWLNRIIVFVNRHINRINRYISFVERHIRTIFFIFFIVLTSITFYFYCYNFDVGVFNDLNHTLVIVFIIDNFLIILLAYYSRYGRVRHSRRMLLKKTSILTVITISFFVIPTILINGYYYWSPKDADPDWQVYTREFTLNNHTYNVSVKADNYIATRHGFFIDSPLVFVVYDGYIKFNKGELSNSSTIDLVINPMPYPYDINTGYELKTLTKMKTKKYNASIYNLSYPSEPTLFAYTYSGIKDISYVLVINGSEYIPIVDIQRMEIEKGHIKAQFDFSKVVIILSIWAIYLVLIYPIGRLVDWFLSAQPSDDRDDISYT